MKKKILMIIPRLADGGAERVVSNLTIGLNKYYEIDILLDCDCINYPYKGNIILLSKKSKESGGLKQVALYAKKYLLLKKMKKEKKYDAYISHSRISNIINILSGYKRSNVLATVHCSLTKVSKGNYKEQILKRIDGNMLRRARKIVVVSEGIKKELIKENALKECNLYYIWNGCNVGEIIKKRELELNDKQRKWFDNSDFTITTMGRYVYEKGHWHLLYAFKEVLKKHPKTKLILIGEGELREYYERLIYDLNIENNVILTGFQSNPFSIIKNSDLFVFPSVSEGFPCSLVEAICCGVPCVSADFHNGAREILGYDLEKEELTNDFINLEYGMLVPCCSGRYHKNYDTLEKEEHIMAEGIQYMIENREVSDNFVKNNRKRIDQFSLEEMTEQWKSVIEM